MKTQRKMSEQAQVASIARKAIKAMGLTGTARSDSFAGGDSVDVTVNNPTPKQMEELESSLAKYEYGSFNGMEDIYEYTNTRSDIPQTKYLHIGAEFSDELKQEAWAVMRGRYAWLQEAPENHVDAMNFRSEHREYASQDLWRFLNGSDSSDVCAKFWADRETKPRAKISTIPTSTRTSATIEEHTHTKKGFQMFIVVFADRVDRDTFTSLRTTAQSMGGWYSRQWGDTPGGFAFKDIQTAQKFVNTLGSTDLDTD